MELPIKHPPHMVPDYSLTGDILSFSRCERSYRYYNGSSLPPSRPVQMWYGEFIHGMLETCFRLWCQNRGALPFPLPYTLIAKGDRAEPPSGLDRYDIRGIGWPIEQALAREGKLARSVDARISAYARAEAAINQMAPHLFPLVEAAERTVRGTRPMLTGTGPTRAGTYILQGIVDVLGHVQVTRASDTNPVVEALSRACPDLPAEYEIIIDYKGSRRPPISDDPRSDWLLGEWQIQTYAWLRSRQPGALPVAAGVLVYVSELNPGSKEMRLLKAEIASGETDVRPERGGADQYSVDAWMPGTDPALSQAFRLARALRVLPITDASMAEATLQIDRVVAEVEARVLAEQTSHRIKSAWVANSQSEETCIACDFRNGCENYNART